MSFQSSSHFDSTMLLIVRPEIDNTIKSVENGVSNLLEDGSLPFGIDDALQSLEQCSHILQLLEQPAIGKLTGLIAKVMQKIIADAGQQNIVSSDVEAMSEATNVSKRYLDFLCVRETRAPQFLTTAINKLEMVLDLPLTPEGHFVSPFLATIKPQVQFSEPAQLPDTQYVSRLYKLSLLNLLKEKESDLDFQALSLCGNYLASAAKNTPSASYWGYVHLILSQLNNTILTEPRLRVLINVESNIQNFLAQPQHFTVNTTDLADIIMLSLSQDNDVSQQIRQQLNIVDDVLSDDQLEVLSRQLYGPDLHTIQTVVKLLSDQVSEVSNKLETSQYQTNDEERQAVCASLDEISNVLDVINLNDAAQQLRTQNSRILSNQNLDNQQHATQLMNTLLFTTNSLQILERNYTPSRLKLKLHNTQITLEKVEEAQQILCNEARISIQNISERVLSYSGNQTITEFETLPELLREVSGALLFLESQQDHDNLQKLAQVIETDIIPNSKALDTTQVKLLATVIASADFYLEQLQNQQPVIKSSTEIGKQYLDQFVQVVA